MREWIAFGFLVLQWLLLTSTIPFQFEGVRWYHQLIISLAMYLLMGKRFKLSHLGKYKWVYGLHFSGMAIMLALIGASAQKLQAAFAIKAMVEIGTFWLIIPVLSHPMARRVLFYTILYTALTKTMQVYEYTQVGLAFGDVLRAHANDKVTVSIWLCAAATTLLPYLITKYVSPMVRLLSGSLILIFIAALFSAVSRGASVVLFVTVLLVAGLHFFSRGDALTRMRTLVVLVLFGLISVQTFAFLSQKYGFIESSFQRLDDLVHGQTDDISGRLDLMYAGLEHLGDSGYFVGSGYHADYFVTQKYLGRLADFHNWYLGTWVRLGLPALLALLLFNIFVYREIIYQMSDTKNHHESLIDFSMSLVGIPIALSMLYFDMGYIWFFISIYAGFEYQRRLSQNASVPQFNRRSLAARRTKLIRHQRIGVVSQ